MLPSTVVNPSSTLEEFAERLMTSDAPSDPKYGPVKNAGIALLLLLDLRNLINDGFTKENLPRTGLTVAQWEGPGRLKWMEQSTNHSHDLQFIHNIFVAMQLKGRFEYGYDTFKRAVRRIRERAVHDMSESVRSEYFQLFAELKIEAVAD